MTPKKYRWPLKICIDFDGTIVEHAFPEIGVLLPGAIQALKRLQAAGHKLILWTCRTDGEKGQNHLSEAVKFMHGHGIEFRAINEMHPDDRFMPIDGRKIYADIYIDDRNLGGFPGWHKVIELILGEKL